MDTLDDDKAEQRGLPGRRHLRATRNSLILLLPIVFTGAIAQLLARFPYSSVLPASALIGGEQWRALAQLVSTTCSGIVALGLLILISYFLAAEARDRRHAEVSPPLVSVLALTVFFMLSRFPDANSAQWIIGLRGVLPAILVAIASTELYLFFSRTRLLRFGQRTYDLDPFLHLALTSIVPLFATVTVFALASRGYSQLSFDPSRWIAAGIIALDGATDSRLPGLMLLSLLNQLLWFVGLHGPRLLEGVNEIVLAAPAGAPQLLDISKHFFYLYVHIGGSGSTLGLLLAVLILARQGEDARVARYASIPSLFNINEVLVFGLPIIFNPIYLLPFILAPAAQIALSYGCLRLGWIALDVTLVPWMTPPILGGIINSGSWHGGALQLLCIVMSALIYAPFVRIATARKKAESLRNIMRIVTRIETIKGQRASVLDRHDEVGHAARKLLHEFVQDIGSERVYLAYQPQHNRSGRVVGVEALLRWRHRHFGHVSPAVVCALLEEARRINPLGRWAIATACGQLRDWKSAGIEGLRVSINLSPLQLRDTGLVAQVAECLAKNALGAREIALELTESQHVPDDALSLATLKGLEQMGVDLEMDDFGMGYSSMLYIRRFKFAAIKLDGVLTRDVLADKNCRDIIASVVQLGDASGIRVVAEYVETREQQKLLEALGCNEFQGYLYSPPLAAAQCLDYLRKHSADTGLTVDTRLHKVRA